MEYAGFEGESKLSIVGPAQTVTNTYEPNRNVLLTKTNQRASNNATISSVTYEVNSIGQRKKRTTTDATASSVVTDWNYDTLGQVTSEDKTGTDTDRAYQYDTIGNRKKSADSLTLPPTDNYTSNALNQYEDVNSFSITSAGYDNDGNQINAQIKGGAGLQPAIFSWDAQNRLIEVKDLNSNSLVKHYYDSYSRKIATITSPLPLGEGQGEDAQLTTLYIFNGWNSIAEYRLHNSSITLHTSLTWGPDLSGSMQGAGGVGGLLCLQEFPLPVGEGQGEGQSYFPCYDGNGNISEYLDTIATVVAHYQYDAFGNTTIATGTKANDFTYRFSTKPRDTTSGLYYYGYRWYEPIAGRWLSRDPIEEIGGMNLYGFVRCDGINDYDIYGLIKRTGEGHHEWAFTPLSNSRLAECIKDELEKIKIPSVAHKWTQAHSAYNDIVAEVIEEIIKEYSEKIPPLDLTGSTCPCNMDDLIADMKKKLYKRPFAFAFNAAIKEGIHSKEELNALLDDFKLNGKDPKWLSKVKVGGKLLGKFVSVVGIAAFITAVAEGNEAEIMKNTPVLGISLAVGEVIIEGAMEATGANKVIEADKKKNETLNELLKELDSDCCE